LAAGPISVASGTLTTLMVLFSGYVVEKVAKPSKKKIPQETKVLPCTEEQLKTYLEIAQGINQGRLGTAQAGKLEELILGLMQFLNNNSRF